MQSSEQTCTTHVVRGSSGGNVSLLVNIAELAGFSLGPSVRIEGAKSMDKSYEFEREVTSWFEPGREFVAAAQGVKDYLRVEGGGGHRCIW